MKLAPYLLTWVLLGMPLQAEERFLLAADTQVIEVNRAGRVTEILKHPGHDGIYDAWRLPDGGIAYAYRGGLAVYDASKKLVMEHASRAGSKGAESNSCTVLDGGARFALMDSGVCQIREVDRRGAVVSETALPDLKDDALHFRYRMIREVPGEQAYWVGQYGRKTLLKVEKGTGRIERSISLEPLLNPSPDVQKAFAMVQPGDGSLFVSTSTGCQLLHVDAGGKVLSCRTAKELGLSCKYLLGMQWLTGGHVLIACGDFHLKTPDESRDLLAEITAEAKVVWRVTREQLVGQIEGHMEKGTGLEEMRITNVHAYDSERLNECLNVKR